MALLRRPATRLILPVYRTITCPHNGHQISLCRGLCRPVGGLGTCGRQAPHALIGRTQAAISSYVARQAGAAR